MQQLSTINYVNAVSIIEEKHTIGSGPLKVLGDDGNIYYAKTTSLKLPRVELINEIFYAYCACLCDLNVPEFCIISISPELFGIYNSLNTPLSARYDIYKFKFYFFGSKLIPNSIEFSPYYQIISDKHEYNSFANPFDFYKVGVLDYWLCNKDRKPNNPNLLISQVNNRLLIHPIDHTASFGFSSSYLDLNKTYLFLPEKFRILSCNYIKSIGKFAKSENIVELKNIMLCSFNCILENLDFIFKQIPNEFGLSNKAKDKIRLVLNDDERNKVCASSYQNYVQ